MSKLFVPFPPRLIIAATLLMLVSILLSGCGPSQPDMDALTTQVAASILSTLTAQAPLVTPTLEPTVTEIPTQTPIPLPTETPAPDAVVAANSLNVREGPGTDYAALGRFAKEEEVDVMGQFENCSWLMVSSRSQTLTGWIAGTGQYVTLRTPCDSIPLGIFRPKTGINKPNVRTGGFGQISVDNGTSLDGVVILTYDGDPVTAAYIRAGESFTLTGLRDGIYYLYFSTGTDWNGKEFIVSPSYKRFDDSFEFTTTSTAYTIWNVTLHGVVGGTASSEDVSESEFPDIGE